MFLKVLQSSRKKIEDAMRKIDTTMFGWSSTTIPLVESFSLENEVNLICCMLGLLKVVITATVDCIICIIPFPGYRQNSEKSHLWPPFGGIAVVGG